MPIWAGESAPNRKVIALSLLFRTILETSTAPRSLWQPYAISSKVDAKAKLPTHYLLKAENGLELPSLVLMEQLRTIDKRRLETYIGHLEEQHIRRLNRALAVSVGLIEETPKNLIMCLCEETPKNLIMCLCPACANNFYGTGSYYLRRVHPGRVEKDICTYCGQRPGFDYEVVKKKERK